MSHHNHFPFTGVIDCNLKLELLGLPVIRKMRLVYGYAPDWPYYQVKSKTVEHGLWDRALSCEVEASCSVPNPGFDGGPQSLDVLSWEAVNGLLKEGILSEAQWAKIDALIDHDAKRKDAENKLSDCHPRRHRRFSLDLSGV